MSTACQSQFIKRMFEDMGTTSPIILPNVSSKILAKVSCECTYNKRSQRSSEAKHCLLERDVKRLDGQFVKVDLEALNLILRAADYLHIKSLVDFTCQAIANNIKARLLKRSEK